MRIHSNVIGYTQQIRNALTAEIGAGRIAPSVTFRTLSAHRSRTHDYAYEIQLEAGSPGQGRRAGNSGSYGAMRPEIDGYAATYDEWGWLLAALYRIDPAMVVGTGANRIYVDAEHFHEVTGYTYAPVSLAHTILTYGDPYPYVEGQGARTKRGYLIGRRGYGRSDRDAPWKAARPRTVEDVLAFAHMTRAEFEAASAHPVYVGDGANL